MTRRLSNAAPPLPTQAPLVVFDNVCVLCSGFVQWVIRHDRAARFRFTPAQGPLGQALYADLGLDRVDFETNLLILGRTAHGGLDAFIEVAVRLGGIWRAAAVLRLLPATLRDRLYRLVARNRYRIFGRRDTCWLPDPAIAQRVL